VLTQGDQPLPALLDLGLGRGPVRPRGALDRLAWLEFLVHLEEVLDLQPVELRHVMDVAQVLLPRVGGRHGQDLVVQALLVPHAEHPDDPAGDQAAGEGRFLEQHEHVERVPIVGQGVLDVPVVVRVPGRGEQHAVQPDAPGRVVHLVLVALPLGDLDDNLDVHGSLQPDPGD
jgi:hypothetical protein